jgi:hypothetical protein
MRWVASGVTVRVVVSPWLTLVLIGVIVPPAPALAVTV